MKKILSIIFVSMLLLLTCVSYTTAQNENKIIYVDDDEGAEYTNIQEAIDAAIDGDTIFIRNGIYEPSTNIHVYKELIIIGETTEGVHIEHETGSEELSIRAKNVEINSISFRNFRITNQGIYDHAIITNNVFIIDNEEKHWNPEVIYIAGENNEISNNIMTFTGTYDSKNPKAGIFMQCYQSTITNNIITGIGTHTTGLFILDRSYWVDELVKGKNIIEGNTFSQLGSGILLSPTLRPGYNSRIIYNNFIDNDDNALFIISLPSVIDIIENNIRRLIYFVESSDTDDSFRADWSLNYWDENYWDDHDDGPKIIKGSIQSAGLVNQFFHYFVPWISFDWHPAKEPFLMGGE
jgi:hypothetical protein